MCIKIKIDSQELTYDYVKLTFLIYIAINQIKTFIFEEENYFHDDQVKRKYQKTHLQTFMYFQEGVAYSS